MLRVHLEQVHKVLKDIRVLRDLRVLKDPLVQLVLKVLLVAVEVDQDLLVLKVLKVLRVHQVVVEEEQVSP